MKKKIFISLGILVALAIIAYFIFPSIFGGKNVDPTAVYQTEPAQNGNVSVSVDGTGTVKSNQTALLSWETSGKVAAIYAQKGKLVEEGTIIAELDSTSVSQSILQAQIDLVNAKEELDDAINNSEARAQAHLTLVDAQQALDDANEEAESKLYQRASQETIDIARAELIEANDALDKAEKKWNTTKKTDNDGLIYAAGLSQYASARQKQQQAYYNLRYVQDLPDALSVEEANINVELAEAQLLTAKQDWEKIKDGPDQDEVLAAQVKIDIAQTTLDLANISSPFDGTITWVNSKIGDLVTTGTQGFQIDDLSSLLIDVDISEVDITQVQIGQPVNITFDAIENEGYTGVVSDIALTGTDDSGNINFVVTVKIDDPSDEIKPGMTAAVEITVNQLDDILLVPTRAVKTVNDTHVVYILKNGQVLPVEIELGTSSNNYIQVLSGDLDAGDLVILNPPSTSEITGVGNMRNTMLSGGGQ